jgi:hypothetical protein
MPRLALFESLNVTHFDLLLAFRVSTTWVFFAPVAFLTVVKRPVDALRPIFATLITSKTG